MIIDEQIAQYVELIIRVGANVQPDQSVRISAELEHAPVVRETVAACYRAGARYVHVDWNDTGVAKARYVHSKPEHLSYMPDSDVTFFQQMVDEGWARIALVGQEFPDLLNDVDPAAMRVVSQVRAQRLKFYSTALMANRMQWCVAAVPTRAWARQLFPALPEESGIRRLWTLILQACRVDQPDPVAAWRQHDRNLKSVTDFLQRKQVRSLHFEDTTLGEDGLPLTNLVVGLTDRPMWNGAAAYTPTGVQFFPNMPTEEVFTTPHKARTEGYARSTKPTFPFDREVTGAYFRFKNGEVVEFRADKGQDVLEQFFEVPGTKHLGEVALVDVNSPVNQTGVLFREILFDENAVCHIAFGEAYPGGVEGGDHMERAELERYGVNIADDHLDVMIGTDTMKLTGTCADGSEVVIMREGKFDEQVLAGAKA